MELGVCVLGLRNGGSEGGLRGKRWGGLVGHLADGFWLVVGAWDSGTPHNQLWVELSICVRTSRMVGGEGATPGYLFSVNPP